MKHTHENKRIFSTFLLSYLSFLLAMFTCCLIFAGKISRQLLQETVLLKQNLVSSMEQNVETIWKICWNIQMDWPSIRS